MGMKNELYRKEEKLPNLGADKPALEKGKPMINYNNQMPYSYKYDYDKKSNYSYKDQDINFNKNNDYITNDYEKKQVPRNERNYNNYDF